ncbi:unnamed protein product [Anisakis simplex]|uniref:Uncharacterized protein n=1 Tax=Anisakis simplex TaxID=6269 RepID=A0A0M3JT53_ANISI|nr:unnamed protein product [Anisakis simplex]
MSHRAMLHLEALDVYDSEVGGDNIDRSSVWRCVPVEFSQRWVICRRLVHLVTMDRHSLGDDAAAAAAVGWLWKGCVADRSTLVIASHQRIASRLLFSAVWPDMAQACLVSFRDSDVCVHSTRRPYFIQLV